MKPRNQKIYVSSFESRIGEVHIASTEKGVAAVGFGPEDAKAFRRRVERAFPGCDIAQDAGRNKVVTDALRRILGGEKPAGPVPVDVRGTEFQRKVWKVLSAIPPGRALSYGEVARRIGKPGAARAVGGACRSNPIPLLVPCHRVIGSDGSMTGFGGKKGGAMKRRLLEMEGWKG